MLDPSHKPSRLQPILASNSRGTHPFSTMIVRPDWLRRKNLSFATLVAVAVGLLVSFGSESGFVPHHAKDTLNGNRTSDAGPEWKIAGHDAGAFVYDPWRPYDTPAPIQ